MEQITMNPIGVIHSPYKQKKNIPIQGTFKPDVEAWIELKEEYVSGLKDLNEFSHAILILHFLKKSGLSWLSDNYSYRSTTIKITGFV
jgi:tRNA (Thr-GGU) A37 N-methylase